MSTAAIRKALEHLQDNEAYGIGAEFIAKMAAEALGELATIERTMSTAREEGRREGFEKAREMAANLLQRDFAQTESSDAVLAIRAMQDEAGEEHHVNGCAWFVGGPCSRSCRTRGVEDEAVDGKKPPVTADTICRHCARRRGGHVRRHHGGGPKGTVWYCPGPDERVFAPVTP